jgi:hypothetical protein
VTVVKFPEYVDEFIQMTEACLDGFDIKLSLKDEDIKNHIRTYETIGSSLKTTFVVHRTERSFDQNVGEYRARMWSEIPAELEPLLKDKDAHLNRYATLGALISNEDGAEIRAQCLLNSNDSSYLAGLAAASIAQAGQSLIHSIGSVLSPENTSDNAVHELSAWGDLDFEQIQYDYAHFGTASHSDNEWSVNFNMRHKLTLTAMQDNPYYGGGLLSLLWVPRSEFGEEEAIPIQTLNNMEHSFGEAPTFGGWCDSDDNYVFTSFLPNYLKDLVGITDNLINWARIRSHTVGQLVQIFEDTNSKND